jgi:hypothetical protein
MMIRMQGAVLDEGLSAIIRDVNLHAEHIDPQVVGGIDPDLTEVHRPWVDARHLAPAQAAII